ncbi:MAG TPA: hypothetical protein VFL41_09160 [Gaiellaceae bacterium]|nr:hypothetical protein [Gaiellaceae bacterium]
MKLLLILFGAGALFLAVQGWHGESPASSIRGVSKLLEQTSNPHPQGRWVDDLKTACAQRERRLETLVRPGGVDPAPLALYSARILAVHRAYSRRVAKVKAPKPYQADLAQIRQFSVTQEQVLLRVTAAARKGNLQGAAQQAMALRELAGRANALFVRLGLGDCAFRASGMPL